MNETTYESNLEKHISFDYYIAKREMIMKLNTLQFHLPMKKPPTSTLHQSNQRKKNIGTNRHNPKNDDYGTMTNFKYVVKKISGLFTLILYGKSKTSSEAVEHDSARNNNKVRGVSCKYDE